MVGPLDVEHIDAGRRVPEAAEDEAAGLDDRGRRIEEIVAAQIRPSL